MIFGPTHRQADRKTDRQTKLLKFKTHQMCCYNLVHIFLLPNHHCFGGREGFIVYLDTWLHHYFQKYYAKNKDSELFCT